MPSFFFNDPPTTEISPLSLHAALPISRAFLLIIGLALGALFLADTASVWARAGRSEEHTSELQSQSNLVCPLFFLMIRRPPRSPLFPSTPLFRSHEPFCSSSDWRSARCSWPTPRASGRAPADRKSTRLNSSHSQISYALFFF